MMHVGCCLQFQACDSQTRSSASLSLSGFFYPVESSLCGFVAVTILLAKMTTGDFIPST